MRFRSNSLLSPLVQMVVLLLASVAEAAAAQTFVHDAGRLDHERLASTHLRRQLTRWQQRLRLQELIHLTLSSLPRDETTRADEERAVDRIAEALLNRYSRLALRPVRGQGSGLWYTRMPSGLALFLGRMMTGGHIRGVRCQPMASKLPPPP